MGGVGAGGAGRNFWGLDMVLPAPPALHLHLIQKTIFNARSNLIALAQKNAELPCITSLALNYPRARQGPIFVLVGIDAIPCEVEVDVSQPRSGQDHPRRPRPGGRQGIHRARPPGHHQQRLRLPRATHSDQSRPRRCEKGRPSARSAHGHRHACAAPNSIKER